MSSNSSGPADITSLLPPSLNLPPHLSAHKYFFVCTLTVAAWDTLVLSPRTWKLFRSKEWPVLKILFHFMRLFMPIEFTIVAVAFFDTKFSQTQCQHFYLFEPICTAILLACCSLVHYIRINAIYENQKMIKYGLGVLLFLQVGFDAAMCAFYRPMPLVFPAPPSNSGQGCIAGPKFADREWVGLYWLFPTLFYTVTFGLALARSINSLQQKSLSYWKLMLRDGLNLYGAVWIVNMVNMLFWFIAKPKDDADTIKTIVTSMAAVLSTTMSMRIVLSIRGSLGNGGSFNGSGSSTAHSHSHSHSRSAQGNISAGPLGGVRSATSQLGTNSHTHNVIAINPRAPGAQTYSIGAGEGGYKTETVGWEDDKSNSSVKEVGEYGIGEEAQQFGHAISPNDAPARNPLNGVRVTIDKHVDGGFGSR